MKKEWCQYCIWDIIYAKFLQNIRYNIWKIYFKIIQEVSDYFTEDWLCQIPDSFETSEGVGWERINQFQSLQSKYEPVSYPSICSGKIQKSKNRGLNIKNTEVAPIAEFWIIENVWNRQKRRISVGEVKNVQWT